MGGEKAHMPIYAKPHNRHTTETHIHKYEYISNTLKMCSPKQKYMLFDVEIPFLGSCPKDRVKDVCQDWASRDFPAVQFVITKSWQQPDSSKGVVESLY